MYESQLTKNGTFVSSEQNQLYDSYLDKTGTIAFPPKEVDKLPYHMFEYGCAVVYENDMHLLGGINRASVTVTDESYYHYAWNGRSWRSVSTIPVPIVGACAVVYHGAIHVFGNINSSAGDRHLIWDGNEWEISKSPLLVFSENSDVVVWDDKIHILGSTSGTNKSYYHYAYDGENWTKKADLPQYEGQTTAKDDKCFLYNGSIQCIQRAKNYQPANIYIYQDDNWVLSGEIDDSNVYINWLASSNSIEWNGMQYFFNTFRNSNSDNVVFNGTSFVVIPYEDHSPSDYLYPEYSRAVLYNNKIHLLGGRNLYTSAVQLTRYDRHIIFDGTDYYDYDYGIPNIYIKNKRNST